MRWIIFIFLLASSAHATMRCPEAERRIGETPEVAIVRLVESLVATKEISVDELKALPGSGELVNPVAFATFSSATRRHVFGTAFARELKDCADPTKAWSEIRRAIVERILPPLTKTDGERGVAVEKTKHVIRPEVISGISVRARPTQGTTSISRTIVWKGKHWLAYPGGESTMVVLDMETLVPREYPLGSDMVQSPPSYFEKDGRGYLIFHAYSLKVLDLESGSVADFDPTYSKHSVTVSTGKGPLAVISSEEGATGDKDGLVLVDPLGKRKTLRVPVKGRSGHPLAVGAVGGRAQVATIALDGKSLVVLDAGSRKIVWRVPMEGIEHEDRAPAYFESSGGPRILVPEDGRFTIVDPATGIKLPGSIPMPEPMIEKEIAVYSHGGKAHAVYATGNKIFSLDLEDGKSLGSVMGSPETITSAPKTFVHEKKTYVTWAGGKGTVFVAEPASGTVWPAAKVADRFIREIIPMPTADGRIEALVIPRNSDAAPVHIQIIGPPFEP